MASVKGPLAGDCNNAHICTCTTAVVRKTNTWTCTVYAADRNEVDLLSKNLLNWIKVNWDGNKIHMCMYQESIELRNDGRRVTFVWSSERVSFGKQTYMYSKENECLWAIQSVLWYKQNIHPPIRWLMLDAKQIFSSRICHAMTLFPFWPSVGSLKI